MRRRDMIRSRALSLSQALARRFNAEHRGSSIGGIAVSIHFLLVMVMSSADGFSAAACVGRPGLAINRSDSAVWTSVAV